MLYQATQLVFVFEHIISETLQILVLDMSQAILHELHFSNFFSIGFDILFLNLNVKLLHELVFCQLPLEFVKHTRIISI